MHEFGIQYGKMRLASGSKKSRDDPMSRVGSDMYDLDEFELQMK